jgi:predicted nucleic acid-binding Zn ribbon protein
MPTYTYECKNHSDPIRVFVERGLRDDEEKVFCAECKDEAKRIFVAPPTYFLGSGWGKDSK